MKNIIFIILLSLLSFHLFAQKIIDKKLPYKTGQLVNLNLRFGDSIRVDYWDKEEVSVEISAIINGGKLNDALTVTTESTQNELNLKTDFDQKMLLEGKVEDCPGNKNYSFSEKDGKRYYVCSKIIYKIFLPRKAKLQLETINANIDIQGATEAVFAKSISGFVDISWPKSSGAKLAMKTVTGEVFTDFDVDFKSKKQKNPIVGYPLEGLVNGGGPEIRLESVSNNVYLRKK